MSEPTSKADDAESAKPTQKASSSSSNGQRNVVPPAGKTAKPVKPKAPNSAPSSSKTKGPGRHATTSGTTDMSERLSKLETLIISQQEESKQMQQAFNDAITGITGMVTTMQNLQESANNAGYFMMMIHSSTVSVTVIMNRQLERQCATDCTRHDY